jgi:hypothetical protein
MKNLVIALVLAIVMIAIGSVGIVVIARMREAAVRLNCANNMHQIAIALHNYASTFDGFPRVAGPNSKLPRDSCFSWQVLIEPFIEADDLYSKLELEKGWSAEENRYLAVYCTHPFQCTACRDRIPESTFDPTHYIGIAGLGTDASTLPMEDLRAGFFGDERKLSIEQIQDRSSTLVFAMETSQAHGAWTAPGPSTVRGLNPKAAPILGEDRQFGGNHRGITNVAFADCAVHPLRNTIDPKVLEAIVTIKGSRGVDLSGEW